ncbi:hypothetical protein B484DRAFT_434399 [Ochromonadaceae sp. CCMP2298]|nr:hypothetical protein B484DRAFT_434399 [Ochromonadaceae sp. CCMP2298]
MTDSLPLLQDYSPQASFLLITKCINARANFICRVTELPDAAAIFELFDRQIDTALMALSVLDMFDDEDRALNHVFPEAAASFNKRITATRRTQREALHTPKIESDPWAATGVQSTPLSRLNLTVGSRLRVEYDYFRNPTHFTLRVVSLGISGDPAFFQALPHLVVPADALSDMYARGFMMYTPPAGVPSRNTLFPHLPKLYFCPIADWLMFFPMTMSCAAAIEAGPDAMCDIFFPPLPFVDTESFFITADRGAALQPDGSSKADAYGRIVIPTVLTVEEEVKWNRMKNESLHSLDDN